MSSDGTASDAVDHALGAYAHVARCAECRAFALDLLDWASAGVMTPTAVAATLAHHDSGHRDDPFATACERFGLLD